MIESLGELLISDFGLFSQSADDPVLILLQLVKAISALVQRDTTSKACQQRNWLPRILSEEEASEEEPGEQAVEGV